MSEFPFPLHPQEHAQITQSPQPDAARQPKPKVYFSNTIEFIEHFPTKPDDDEPQPSSLSEIGCVLLCWPLNSLATVLPALLTNGEAELRGQCIALEITGRIDPLPAPLTATLLRSCNTFAQTYIPSLLDLPELWRDMDEGHPWALLSFIFSLLNHFSTITKLKLRACCLHEFPMFGYFFNEPKVSSYDMLSTWNRPRHWENTYSSLIFRSVAVKLQALELPEIWSIGAAISSPPHKMMTPVCRFPGFHSLGKLTLPYAAVIPRPRSSMTPFPTSGLPPTLERLTILNAYPSRFLLEWIRAVQWDKGRLVALEAIEVYGAHDILRRYFDGIAEMAKLSENRSGNGIVDLNYRWFLIKMAPALTMEGQERPCEGSCTRWRGRAIHLPTGVW